MAEPSPAGGRRRGGLQLAIIMGAIAVLVVGVVLLIIPDEPVLEMPLSTAPASGEFTVDEATKLAVWAEIDAKHPGIDHGTPARKLPHVFDYDIIIRQGETTIAELRCNPFNVLYLATGSKRGDVRRFEGLLEGCSTNLPAGTYQVEAKLVPGPDKHQGFVLRQSDLLLRID
jgi:hypothetical protein